jgi:hypothetical protein
METQAAEIDGRILINDVSYLGFEAESLRPGDFIEVEIVEAMPHDLVGKALRIISRGKGPTETSPSGLKTFIPAERRPDALPA